MPLGLKFLLLLLPLFSSRVLFPGLYKGELLLSRSSVCIVLLIIGFEGFASADNLKQLGQLQRLLACNSFNVSLQRMAGTQTCLLGGNQSINPSFQSIFI